MMNNTAKRGNIEGLSLDERAIVETKIIPTAKRWAEEYPEGSSLWVHGRATLEYWNKLHEVKRPSAGWIERNARRDE